MEKYLTRRGLNIKAYEFENNKAIYEQMADRLCDEIIAGTYKADDRIPSVREYAVMLQVNTNTAVKAMSYSLVRRLYTIGVDLATLFQLVHVSKL